MVSQIKCLMHNRIECDLCLEMFAPPCLMHGCHECEVCEPEGLGETTDGTPRPSKETDAVFFDKEGDWLTRPKPEPKVERDREGKTCFASEPGSVSSSRWLVLGSVGLLDLSTIWYVKLRTHSNRTVVEAETTSSNDSRVTLLSIEHHPNDTVARDKARQDCTTYISELLERLEALDDHTV